MKRRPLRRALAISPGLALGLLALVLTVASATPAAARTETLRWTQANPNGVSGFRIYWGTQSRNYTQTVDTGRVSPDSSGVYHYSITVPDNAVVYIAVTSYNAAGRESTYSNERQRSPSTSTGGTTTPPPPSGSGSGAGSGSGSQPLGAPGQPTLVQ